MRRKLLPLLALIPVAVWPGSPVQTGSPGSQFSVLVFSKTAGFRHSSIPNGIAALKKLGSENNFNVAATEDASTFNDANLRNYRLVIFLNTTGDVLDDSQQAAFERLETGQHGFTSRLVVSGGRAATTGIRVHRPMSHVTPSR